MRDSNSNRLFTFLMALIAMLAISVNSAIASDDDERGGFCDCSESGDLICHVPPGNHRNMHTIQVGAPAINAHLAHGDMLGACPGDEDAVYDHHRDHGSSDRTCVCDDGNIGILYHLPTTTTTAPESMRTIHGQ